MAPRAEGTTTRLKKEELLAKLAPLEDGRLRQLLCEVYRGGPDTVRARIEAVISPEATAARPDPEDAGAVLDGVRAFLDLVDADAFLFGREVSPKRKTQWRHEYRKAFEDLARLLSSPAVERASALLEEAIELATRVDANTHFRSEDPNEAAKVVVSDQVAALWTSYSLREGVPGLLSRALPQLWAWERQYGWTRGFGSVAGRERALGDVLAGLLTVRPAWERAASAWRELLDARHAESAPPAQVTRGKQARPLKPWELERFESERRRQRERRAMNLCSWHTHLAEQLGGDDPLVQAVLDHPAVDAPYTWLVKAKVAEKRGALTELRALIERGLDRLPGFDELVLIGLRAGIELPPKAEQLATERKLRERLARHDQEQSQA